jgi:hypothetical protein
MKKLKGLIKNTIFFLNVLIHFRKEPYFNFRFLLQYFFKGTLYLTADSYKHQEHAIQLRVAEEGYWLSNSGAEVLYPKSFPERKALGNFRSVVDEQTQGHPHLYNYPLIKEGWVIYDIGAAEGYQVFQWLKRAKKIVLFEPEPDFYDCLRLTFRSEIESGKVMVINYGIGKRNDTDGNSPLKFAELPWLMEKFDLPAPDYVKADIEGNEMLLLGYMESMFRDKIIKMIEITTYHRPNDYKNIKEFLSRFGGKSFYSAGNIFLNIDGWENQGSFLRLYQPVMRKVLYTHIF